MYSWVHMSLVFDNDLNVNGGGWGTGLWKTSPREEWLSGTRVLVLGKSGVRAAASVKMVVSRGFDISDFYRLGVSTVGRVPRWRPSPESEKCRLSRVANISSQTRQRPFLLQQSTVSSFPPSFLDPSNTIISQAQPSFQVST